MKDKLLKALNLTNNPKFQQIAKQAQANASVIRITWTQAGFEKEMARRRYNR